MENKLGLGPSERYREDILWLVEGEELYLKHREITSSLREKSKNKRQIKNIEINTFGTY